MNKIIDAIDELRLKNKSYVTNSFFSYEQLSQMLERQPVYQKDGLIVIAKNTPYCTYLYWFAADCRSLRNLHCLLDKKQSVPVITELIGNTSFCSEISSQLLGFNEYNKLTRMLYKASGDNRFFNDLTPTISVAGQSDLQSVRGFLYDSFDVLTSHLPSDDELLKMLSNGEVYTVEGNPEKGTAIFNRNSPHMWYLYQIAVGKQFRGRGYARSLLQSKLITLGKMDKMTLWAEDGNNRAQTLYCSAGFVTTDIHTVIYKGE